MAIAQSRRLDIDNNDDMPVRAQLARDRRADPVRLAAPRHQSDPALLGQYRKRVVSGKIVPVSVDLGCRLIIKKPNKPYFTNNARPSKRTTLNSTRLCKDK